MSENKIYKDVGEYDFELNKNVTFSRVFTYTDENGVAINLTGYTAAFRARPSSDYGADTIVKTGLTINAAAGQITLKIDPADTANIGDSDLIYSILLTIGSDVFPFLIGKIKMVEKALT